MTPKEKILEAACEIFAEKGFRGATVRDICQKTKSYQISINYYFGGKENLYKEALLYAYNYSDENIIMEKLKNNNDMSSLEKLKILIKTHYMSLALLAEPKNNQFFRILMHEIHKQEQHCDMEIIEKTIKVYMTYIFDLLIDIKGSDDSNFDVKYLAYTIIGQFMAFPNPLLNIKSWMFDGEITEDNVNKLTENVMRTIMIFTNSTQKV